MATCINLNALPHDEHLISTYLIFESLFWNSIPKKRYKRAASSYYFINIFFMMRGTVASVFMSLFIVELSKTAIAV